MALEMHQTKHMKKDPEDEPKPPAPDPEPEPEPHPPIPDPDVPGLGPDVTPVVNPNTPGY